MSCKINNEAVGVIHFHNDPVKPFNNFSLAWVLKQCDLVSHLVAESVADRTRVINSTDQLRNSFNGVLVQTNNQCALARDARHRNV